MYKKGSKGIVDYRAENMLDKYYVEIRGMK